MPEQKYQFTAAQGINVPHGQAVAEGSCNFSAQDFGTYASNLPYQIPTLRILDDQPIHTDLKMCDGLFVKIMTFAAGSFIPQHSHETPHLSVIATGIVRAWKDGVLLGEFRAPTGIVIEAHAKHMFEALETNTMIMCVHRVDEGDEPEIHDLHEIETV